MKRYSGPLMLLLTAMIWGAAFVAQSVGMDYVGPFTFNSARNFLGAAVLIPFILIGDRRRTEPQPQKSWRNRELWLAGLICGVILAVATSLQQLGLIHTTVGKAGFITTLYVVLVPLLGLFVGKRVRGLMWLCVALAVAGLYFLCMSGSAALGVGDLLVLGCAVVYSFHILAVDHFSPRVDGVKLSFLQFIVSGIISAVPAVALETNHVTGLLEAWIPLLYAGILSCGVGYTLQILGQQRTDPTVASIVMCMESVFSVLFGWLLLHQALSPRELGGCALMLAAILLSQLPEKRHSPSEQGS